jgi:hypothetical protein
LPCSTIRPAPLNARHLTLNAVRMARLWHFRQRYLVRGMRFLQVMSQVHIQGDRHTHYDQSAPTQYQKPPDHPHSRLG